MENAGFAEFIDSPAPEQFKEALAVWQWPELPAVLARVVPAGVFGDFEAFSGLLKHSLRSLPPGRSKLKLEGAIMDWLYSFIRRNIIRGRIFDLREVLKTARADCLGYCKLFTIMGRLCGLDAGVVDVVIDNRGMAVPHTAILLMLSSGHRFLDFWYGSKDIHHKKIGLFVKRASEWKTEDIDARSLKSCRASALESGTAISSKNKSNCEDFRYLPNYCVDAITLYIEGNRLLKNGDCHGAIEKYSRAARLYPANSRVFYNRAIAYERTGESGKSKRDYARALRDEASKLRTLATQPEEIVDLIKLDENHVPEEDQQVFLLYNGFVTGRQVSPADISRRSGETQARIKTIIDSVNQIVAKTEE